jgi:hypothetical protein
MESKTCRRCTEEKPIGEFYARQRGRCKVCIREVNMQRYRQKRASQLAARPPKQEVVAKKCSKCSVTKPVEAFYTDRRPGRQAKAESWCKACRCSGSQRYYERTRPAQLQYARNYWLQDQYGITTEEYNALFEEQRGLCKLCNNKERGTRRLSVDHDHATGRVRGLLCVRCNSALGTLGDNVEGLERALAYVRGT